MSSTITMNITQQQLESIIFNAVQDALSKSSGKAPRAPRKASATTTAPAPTPAKDAPTSSSASDAGSVKSKRSLGQATQDHINLTKQITPLVSAWKEANKERITALKSDERFTKLFGQGFHLKVQGILKPKIEGGSTLSNVLVNEAIDFLISNPDHQSANAKNKATKPTKVATAPTTTPSTTTQEPATTDSAPAPAKARGRPKKSADTTAPKPAKATKPKKVAPPPPAVSDSESSDDEEDEDVQMTQISIGGTDYLWNEEDGSVYEVAEGGLGERIGTSTDGTTITYA